ncbi:Glycosyl transferase family 2 [Humidesulfovibrio mexicanus]|uniref:Glycosyl transferase family 2 n=1 Tax=Humidesulfovibrio mexicanus TaxID=147047 RepID=A0A238YU76_9BACT|nr:glycosyltransferase family 2 protein [Humidesulfovibrio mexicanus]SNR74009.1 Glycosyl transferase family 2 [Humidesulfovibrio mexicanus]
MPNTQSVSIVIPVYNEQDNLPVLFDEIARAMRPLNREWEVVFVDDGSSDASLGVLKRLAAENAEVRYIAFTKNRGQSAAFCAGFDQAAFPIVVTMDADLQNDPADIPAMLALFDQGYGMAIGWRKKRQDTASKRYASKIANAIRNRITRESVRDTGCSLKIMRRDVLLRIPRFKGMHRYLPTLMKLEGASVAEMPVNHRERHMGVSKYGNWERAVAGVRDLLGVRWLQDRHFNYEIREKNR